MEEQNAAEGVQGKAAATGDLIAMAAKSEFVLVLPDVVSNF